MSDTNDSFAPTNTRTPEASAASRGSETVSFATFNVLHGSREDGGVDLEAFRQSIRALPAEIIGLQEVDVNVPRSGRVNLAAEAGAAAGGRFAFAAALHWLGRGKYGNALIAQRDVRDVQVIKLPRASRHEERRTAMAATVATAAGDWSVVNTHLTMNRENNAPQLEQILDIAEEMPEPRVVLGDFNRTPDEVKEIAGKRGWKIAEAGPTYPASNPGERIDYVMCQGADVMKTQVVKLGVSDHCAVVAELRPEA